MTVTYKLQGQTVYVFAHNNVQAKHANSSAECTFVLYATYDVSKGVNECNYNKAIEQLGLKKPSTVTTDATDGYLQDTLQGRDTQAGSSMNMS